MQAPAFLTIPSLPVCTSSPTVRIVRIIPIAKKSGGPGKKARKPPRSKRTSQSSAPPPTPSPQTESQPSSSSSFQGPFAPEFPQDPPLLSSDLPSDDSTLGEIPVADEARLKLPNLAPTSGVRRKRKPRTSAPASSDLTDTPPEQQTDMDTDRLSSGKIRELTAAYRRGGAEAADVITELEKDPDYLLQIGNPEGEYDLASAIIGTGQPNKQGVYLLPYLQNGHILLLLIVVVCTFVYYPGFPLTEFGEGIRDGLKKGLAATYLLNAALAVLAYRDAKKRLQPQLFWAFKTALLGNLALSELRASAPLQKRK